MQRSPEQIIKNHLQLAQNRRLEEDMQANYSADCILLTSYGAFEGYPGILKLARLLQLQLAGATYEYTNILVKGKVGFLEWKASCEKGFVEDGADTFVIEGGKIVAQTIHYTFVKRD